MTDLENFMGEKLQDPEFARIYAEQKAILDRSVERECEYGNCVEFYDPVNDELVAGWGPIDCPCED